MPISLSRVRCAAPKKQSLPLLLPSMNQSVEALTHPLVVAVPPGSGRSVVADTECKGTEEDGSDAEVILEEREKKLA